MIELNKGLMITYFDNKKTALFLCFKIVFDSLVRFFFFGLKEKKLALGMNR